MPLLRKDELEISLKEEKELIKNGKLREDNPLDLSKEFQKLCEACRRGDLKSCQEMITEGANLNARDEFDYTPLILVSIRYQVILVAASCRGLTLLFGRRVFAGITK